MIKMVDFNNETTVGTPAVDVVRILILQRRADVIEALEVYNKQDDSGVDPPLPLVKSRIYSFFLELQGALKRKLCKKDKKGKNKSNDYDWLIKQLKSNKFDELVDVFLYLNEYLDSIKLTRIDTKEQYDRSSFETDNRKNGIR